MTLDKDWIKFLKDDYDYDWANILRLLAYKISRVRKYIDGSKYSTLSKEDKKCMLEVERLLKKVSRDEYDNDKEIRKYFPNDKVLSKFSFSNLKKVSKRDVRRALRRAVAERDIDLRRAFDLIATHIYNWWD